MQTATRDVEYVTIKIAADIHRKLSVYAAQTGASMQDIASNAILLHIGPACKLPKKPTGSAK